MYVCTHFSYDAYIQLLTSVLYGISILPARFPRFFLEMSVASVYKYLAHAKRAIATMAPEYINFSTPINGDNGQQ